MSPLLHKTIMRVASYGNIFAGAVFVALNRPATGAACYALACWLWLRSESDLSS